MKAADWITSGNILKPKNFSMLYNILLLSIYHLIKCFDKKKKYPDLSHAISSVFFLSAFLSINVLIIISVLRNWVEVQFFVHHMLVFGIILVFNLFYFLFNQNYVIMDIEMNKKSLNSKRSFYLFAFIYYVLTVSFLVII